jgi:hypothetical protein
MQHLRISRSPSPPSWARRMLEPRNMRAEESWTLPLHIILWTTMVVALVMVMAVLMMH